MIGIDPGTTKHGVVEIVDGRVVLADMFDTDSAIALVAHGMSEVACEWIESYGMPVGKELFQTVFHIGRMFEADPSMRLIPRRDIKLHLCGQPRAKDANIRQALLDKLGPVGTKKNPGPCYGVSGHLWSALAVAVTAAEIHRTNGEWIPDAKTVEA